MQIFRYLFTTECEFNNFNIGTLNVILTERNGQANWKFDFINTIAVILFLLQLSFACNPAFYFNMKKSYKAIYHSPPYVSIIIGNILIWIKTFAHSHLLLASSSTYTAQKMKFSIFHYTALHFLCSVRCNSDLKILASRPLLLASTKSVICQIDANCSPFQSLNMRPFHIRLERLKLIYYGLISSFRNITLKLAKFAYFSHLHIYLRL